MEVRKFDWELPSILMTFFMEKMSIPWGFTGMSYQHLVESGNVFSPFEHGNMYETMKQTESGPGVWAAQSLTLSGLDLTNDHYNSL